MTLIEWTDDLDVGVADLNEHHQKIINAIMELFLVLQEDKGHEVADRMINDLEDYFGEHFKAEEKLFEEHNYPDAEAHKLEHENMIKEIRKYMQNEDAGEQVATREIVDFFKDWFLNHVKEHDMKYKTFFHKKGVN